MPHNNRKTFDNVNTFHSPTCRRGSTRGPVGRIELKFHFPDPSPLCIVQRVILPGPTSTVLPPSLWMWWTPWVLESERQVVQRNAATLKLFWRVPALAQRGKFLIPSCNFKSCSRRGSDERGHLFIPYCIEGLKISLDSRVRLSWCAFNIIIH